MKKPCDCDKPKGAPPDSVRSMAALWTSAGRVVGYADAVEQNSNYLHGSAEGIIDAAQADLSKKQKRKLVAALQSAATEIRKGNDGRRLEAETLKKTAIAMVERLEQPKRSSFRARLAAALEAIRR